MPIELGRDMSRLRCTGEPTPGSLQKGGGNMGLCFGFTGQGLGFRFSELASAKLVQV